MQNKEILRVPKVSGTANNLTGFLGAPLFLLVNLLFIAYIDPMETESDKEIFGKKIFFLFPSTLVRNEVIPELIQLEYEVYITSDANGLKTVLRKYPNSIVFVNIDDGMAEKDWDIWVRGVMGTTDSEVSIGILSSGSDEIIQRKYVNSIRVQAGFVPVKSDINKVTKQIVDTLKTLDAKGRRKFIRVTSDKDSITTINIPYDSRFLTGQIKDISVVGLSCTFDEDPDLDKGTYIKDIQIKLQGTLLKTEGIVFGSRMDGMYKVYVFLFTTKIDPDVRMKIRKYMQTNLQSKMDTELK